jgi:hypothetical protein
MSYTKTNWENLPSTNTPINATNLNKIEQGIKDNADDITLLKPVVLYANETGSNSSITLSESSANFDYIEIFYKSNDDYYNSLKIYKPNGKMASLSCWYTFTSEAGTYLKVKTVNISGTTISNVTKTGGKSAYAEVNITTDSDKVTKSSSNYIWITRVIGYK